MSPTLLARADEAYQVGMHRVPAIARESPASAERPAIARELRERQYRAIIATEVGDSDPYQHGWSWVNIHRSRTRAGAQSPQTAKQMIKREERMNVGRWCGRQPK